MEWKTVKLGDVCDLIAGFAFKAKDFGDYPQKVVKIGDITPPYVSYNSMAGIDMTPYSVERLQKYKVVYDDFVLAMTGATIGKVGRYINEDFAYLNQRVLLFKPHKDVCAKYIYFLVCAREFQMYVQNHIDSESAQPNISANTLSKYTFTLPPLAEQKRIAAILSSLDAKIENNNRINANLEAQAQALYKSWFVDFEPWGGVMPEDWKEGVLGDIVTVKRGGSPRPIQDYLSDKGYRWLKISDATAEASPFISHIVEHIKEEGLSKTVFIKQGSLVLSNSATPGLPKFVDLDTCIHDGWLYFPQSYFSNEYLYLLFQRERSYLLSQGNGSVFTNLKTDIVKNLCVTIPAEDVLNSFQKIIRKVFMEILNNQRENSHLAALRDTLLPKLMKGEIKV